MTAESGRPEDGLEVAPLRIRTPGPHWTHQKPEVVEARMTDYPLDEAANWSQKSLLDTGLQMIILRCAIHCVADTSLPYLFNA